MSGSQSNFVIEGSNASLHNAEYSAIPDLTSPAVKPSAVVANEVLANAEMPSRESISANSSSLAVKQNNRVTKTVNLDGSVTYEGYGIKGTVKEIELRNGVKGVEHSFTISNAPQYQELSDKVKELFRTQYPGKGDYFIADFSADLKGGAIITILDQNGKAISNKNYNQHESLGKEHNLELAPSELRPGLAMLHLLKRAFYEFKELGGNPLDYNNSSNRHDIGSIDDPATLGNYALRFKGEPGSWWSPGLSVGSFKVDVCGYLVDRALDFRSAAFVRPVPE
jgi:hypothetical protein